jgi:CRISPR system Cascade subunit CasA
MTPASDLPSFNLLDEPWLPVRFTDGTLREVGLLEVFARANEISSLGETSPPNLMAEYRLLLAITHRAMTRSLGNWKDSDRARWFRNGFPQKAFTDYLEHWRERFWLFHPEQPFMQVAALANAEETRDKYKPWTQISLASACGAAPTLFDHAVDSEPETISPAFATCLLLGFLQCTPGGLIKVIRGSDKAGPLANTAGALPVGCTLHETLCLALHPFSFAASNDLPSWELPALKCDDLAAEAVLATGANDRYTRISRAVLLIREENLSVKWIRFAAGAALLEEPTAPDPMASYRAGFATMVRLSFTEGRAFWRDLPALLPDADGKAALPAAVLSYAGNLNSILGTMRASQSIVVAGIASDQAKLLRWRLVQIVLPTPFLVDLSLANGLRDKIQVSESLHDKLSKLARAMYAATMPDPETKEAYTRAKAILESGPADAMFFAKAERGLANLIKLIAEGQDENAHAHWHRCLVQAAKKMWEVVVRGLGEGPRAICAEAKSYPRLQRLLREYQPEANQQALLTAENS